MVTVVCGAEATRARPANTPPPERRQWVILAQNAVSWLLHDPDAVQFAQYLEHTYMSDETYVQARRGKSGCRAPRVGGGLGSERGTGGDPRAHPC